LTAACETCHSPNGWNRVQFDHDKQTKFALTGAHKKVGCHDCHRQKNVEDASLPTSCYACHKADDAHRGAYGQNCAKCHTTATFTQAFIRQ
jgi:Cytochrome c7 and related cytochrome c